MFENLIRCTIYFSVVRPYMNIEQEDIILTEDNLHDFKEWVIANPNVERGFRLYLVNAGDIVKDLVERWQDLIDDPLAGWNGDPDIFAGIDFKSEFISIVEDRDEVFGVVFKDVLPWDATTDSTDYSPECIQMRSLRFQGKFEIMPESELIAKNLI